VINSHDLDVRRRDAINSDVRQRRKHKLSSSIFTTGTSTQRPLFQGSDGLVQLAHSRLAVSRMMFFEVVVDVVQIRCGGGRPADSHCLGTQHLLQSSVHFVFFDELASVGLGDAFTNSGAKARVLLEQAQSGFFHQTLGVGPGGGRDLRKLRFLLGSEMDFHGSRVREKRVRDNGMALRYYGVRFILAG